MPDREVMEADLLVVGAGPAGLATAIHFMRKAAEKGLKEPMVLLLEKGASVGAHGFSGGILNPVVLTELFPDKSQWKFATQTPVVSDEMRYTTAGGSFKVPHPPGHTNEGNLVVSLNQMCEWLGAEAEGLGVNVLPSFAAAEPLYGEDGAFNGVRTGDKGVGKNGERRGNFEAGIDIHAKVTVLCEGPRGTVAKQAIKKLGLDKGRHPMVYSTGVKELWEVPAGRLRPGHVEHSMGWPLQSDEFGGGFIYHVDATRVAVGFITALDYRDTSTDPHANLQKYKTHPRLRALLEGGKMLAYGAKVIPEGGWDCIPKTYAKGLLLAGDTAGFLDLPRLKGIHLAMKSGMLAAEAALEALLAQDTSEERLSSYAKALEASFIADDLKPARAFRQHFHGNFLKGLVTAGIDLATHGKVALMASALPDDALTLRKLRAGERPSAPPVFDGKLTFNKVTDVYHSGTKHEEDQPAHLKIGSWDLCSTQCTKEFGNPCVRFCPASVYEMEEKDGKRGLKLNPSNCVHCKTCDIKDPYGNITWTVPEGGGGPSYRGL
ncbi:MAG: 4Fe-4S dicluster domain-containing protein [Planctomycetota bacterium]